MRVRLILRLVGWLLGCAGVLTTPAALAQWRIGLWSDYFSWKEDTSPTVRETGTLTQLSVDYTVPRESGLIFGYRGRLYGGWVDYEGSTLFPPIQPVTGTTLYAGTLQEAQMRWRVGVGGARFLDLVAGLGVDAWRRHLSASQKEDYVVGFGRLGIESAPAATGWLAGVGVRLPFHVHENAHLVDVGFQQNPSLRPEGLPSPYLQLGYRPSPMLTILFNLEVLRLGASPAVPVTHQSLGAMSVYQPASTRVTGGIGILVQF